MDVRPLTADEVRNIYEIHMIRDFPRAELKPLRWIIKMLGDGNYECLGLFEDDDLLAYAFFVLHDRHYLFDYLAVPPQKRNGGIGARFLQLLRDYFASADCVLGEIEDPDYAETEDQRQLRERRRRFYLRNGFRETGVSVTTFGVHYLLIEVILAELHSEEDIKKQYLEHYRSMLPEELFQKSVII